MYKLFKKRCNLEIQKYRKNFASKVMDRHHLLKMKYQANKWTMMVFNTDKCKVLQISLGTEINARPANYVAISCNNQHRHVEETKYLDVATIGFQVKF